MNAKIIAAGILMVILALAVSVNAIEIRTSDDTLHISSTEGKVFAYVKNTANEDRDLYVSVDGHRLNAYVDSYSSLVHAGATGGAYIGVIAPDCFRGSEAIDIHAELCSDAACETASKKVIVYVEPAKQCSSYIEGYAAENRFISGTSCGSNGCYQTYNIQGGSRIVKAAYFDPTSYGLRMTGGEVCSIIKRGETAETELTLENRGAAANFDLRVLVDSDVDAFPAKDYVALQRSDAETVSVAIKPSNDAIAGRHFVTVQALHLDQVLAERDLCVDLQDEFKSDFNAPSRVDARTSVGTTIQLQIGNDGTTKETYNVEVYGEGIQNALTVVPSEFSLNPGGKKIVDVEMDTSKIAAGNYKLSYVVASNNDEQRGQTLLKIIDDSQKETAPAVNVEAQSQQKDTTLEISALIQNEGSTDLSNLDLEVQGLPKGWKVSGIPQISVKANSDKTVQFQITMNSDEEATPSLVLKKDGKTISTQALPKISGKAGGFTGLFSLNSQNAILGLVILAAIALFFIMGRRDEGDTSGHGGHMESIKHEVEHGDHGH